ncbi:MAG TPA: hypothetical protein VML75_14815 [Kofleriaceae bacterium]|nr:hypothetical protein [Kofleriaceae bacterium]
MSDLPVAHAKDPSSKAPRSRHKRRLGNYLLDKKLQLRYVAFVTILSAIISGVLGYLIWNQENRATNAVVEDLKMNVQAADSAEQSESWKELEVFVRGELRRDDNTLIVTMVGVGVGLVLVLSLFLVVMTHKVAGPLYKVALYFDKMRDGRIDEVYPLRRGDMLKDFYTKFKDMHDQVRARFQADNEAVAGFLAACEAAGVSREGALGHELDELETHKKRRDQALA